jgi:hypothetical protein
VGVVGRAGADLLRLLIAAVVVGEEEEESRTVVGGGIETDVAKAVCLELLFMDFDLESVIVRYRAQELNQDGKIGKRDKG